MRLLGRSAPPAPREEHATQEEAGQPAGRPAYEELGHRVSSVLNAAEETAATIRAEAQEEAATLRREAQEEAAASQREAARRRQEAEQDAKKKVADAEASARSTREAAERAAREMEATMRRRQEELREEVRAIEDARQRAMYELRDIVGQLQNVLLEGSVQPGDGREGEVAEAEDRDDAESGARFVREDDGPAVRRFESPAHAEEEATEALEGDRG
jgi:uncharacterized protein Yka (UPF0111/DUF47 family)